MRTDAKAALCFIVGAVAWFLPWLLPGKALLGTHPALYRPYDEVFTAEQHAEIAAAAHPLYGDKLIQHDPEVRFGSHAGDALPSWNPWVLGGVPHVAQGLASPLYPLMWIARLVPPPRCYAWIAALQMALQAWFAWRMLRAFEVRPAACGVFALLFAGGGWMSVHQEYFQLTAAATWLPLAIGGARRLLDQKGGLFSLAVAIGCAFLSGFPQVASYTLLAPALLWALVAGTRRFRGEERPADMARHVGRFAVATVLGLALASPQLLATAEFVPHATRQLRTPDALTAQALPAAGLVGALLPDLFTPSRSQADLEAEAALATAERRTPWNDTLWARGWLHSLRPETTINRFEITFALGPAALVLALVGVWRGRRGIRGFLLVLLGAGVVLSVRSPLLFALAHVPGFNIGDPKRALLLVATALAGLAALGVEALLDHARTRRVALGLHAAAGGILLALAGTAWLLPPALLRRIAAPRLAADLSANVGTTVPPEVVAGALPDPLLLAQRALLARECLVAALFVAVAAFALLWLSRWLATRPATDGALEDVRPTPWSERVGQALPLASVFAALGLPLLLLWLDATSPIPIEGLDARPSIVWQFKQLRPEGRLIRLGAPRDSAEQTAWSPKLPMNAGVRDAQGYVAAYLRCWRELFDALEPGSALEVAVLPLRDPGTLTRPLIDLLDVEWVLATLPKDAAPPEIPGFDRTPIDPPPPPDSPYALTLWRNQEPFGRARFVDRVRIVADDADVVAHLVSRDFAPRQVAWLTETDAAPLRADPAFEVEATLRDEVSLVHVGSGGEAASVELFREASNDLRFRVAGNGGLLVQTDAWYPGWIAKIDGVAAPLLRVNHALRGVIVPPGEHEVQFLYVPRRFLLGLFLLPGTAALLILAAAAIGRRKVAR